MSTASDHSQYFVQQNASLHILYRMETTANNRHDNLIIRPSLLTILLIQSFSNVYRLDHSREQEMCYCTIYDLDRERTYITVIIWSCMDHSSMNEKVQ